MALVLDATAKGASANTYVTLADAETYFEGHVYITDWSSATTAEKNAALVMATRLLDDYVRWVGNRATDTQALMWPRTFVWDSEGYQVDSDTVPSFIENATAEFAKHILSKNSTAETGLEGYKEIEVGPLRIVVNPHDRAGTIPPIVWSMINYYGRRKTAQMTLVRM